MSTLVDNLLGAPRPSEARRIEALPTGTPVWAGSEDLPLNQTQREALGALASVGGLIGNIGVGFGKTLIALLSAEAAGKTPVLLLHPASTRTALLREVEKWQVGAGVIAMSYAELSQPGGMEKLADIAPAFIFCDEAHYLKSPKSARTKRLRRYIQDYPGVGFAAVSGTLTKDTLFDYAHLCEWALRAGSPLPRAYSTLDAWARCLDAKPQEWPTAADWAQLKRALGFDSKDDARAAFRRRFESTPGVVTTRAGSVGASLRFKEIGCEIPEIIDEAIRAGVENFERLDGEFLDGPLDLARYLRQLACGFYYRWAYQPPMAWLYARREFYSRVREVIKTGRYDTEKYATDYLREIQDPAWLKWEPHHTTPPPPTECVWVSDYLVEDIERRAAEEPALVWVEWRELFDRLDLPKGDPENQDPDRSCVVSIHADSRGKNLQGWSNNIVVGPPAGGLVWEQMVGRTHRQGQAADTVHVEVYTHTDAYLKALESARTDARYIEETQGTPQKILYGDWS